MGTIIKHLTIVLGILLCASCTIKEEFCDETDGDTLIGIDVCYDGYQAVRSSVTSSESEIKDIQIFVVDSNGDIVSDIYSNTTSGLKFKGKVGDKYKLYAIANNGSRITALSTESDIKAWKYSMDPGRLFPFGIPMAGTNDGQFTATSGTPSVTISLVRLVARIDLTLSCADISEHGTFQVTSLQLRGCPSSIAPFAAAPLSAAAFGDGDRASSDDLARLNAGGALSLYMLENLQGTLLPSNTDPWRKIPDSIGSTANQCSYIEVNGLYSSIGYSGKETYRMYPGSDNVTNFDIRRNTSYKITFCPSDDNLRLTGNWKVTPSEWSDTRSIRLSSSSLSIKPGQSGSLTLTLAPGNFDIAIDAQGFSEAGLSWTRAGNVITVSASSSAVPNSSATLIIKSWDGRVCVTCPVTVQSSGQWYHILTITPGTATIHVGDTLTLQAEYESSYYEYDELMYYGHQDVTTSIEADWDTYDASIATVSKGVVTATGPGRVLIVCVYQGGTDGCVVTVIP